jgi:predicted GNAT family acetyltransferase
VDTAVDVRNDEERERYEIAADGELAGFTQYRLRPGLIAFVHTEIDPRFEGRGLGGQLVGSALDDARARELAVRQRLHRAPPGVRRARAGGVPGEVRGVMAAALLVSTMLLAAAAPPSERACGQTAHRLLVRFVEAYNKGDSRRLDRIFAPEPAFRWYSAPAPGAGRFSPAAEDRATLLPYFAARHRAGDRLRLKRWTFNGLRASDDTGHFEMTFRRRSARGARWHDSSSKGAIVCARRQVIVMSLG